MLSFACCPACDESVSEYQNCLSSRAVVLWYDFCCRIPEGLTRLVGLVELYLNDTFLESLPNSFGRLVLHFLFFIGECKNIHSKILNCLVLCVKLCNYE